MSTRLRFHWTDSSILIERNTFYIAEREFQEAKMKRSFFDSVQGHYCAAGCQSRLPTWKNIYKKNMINEKLVTLFSGPISEMQFMCVLKWIEIK